MQTFWQDLRFGARMLKSKPGFALLTIFTMALGIGANTAIFTVINSVLLRPLPYPSADRLVTMRSNQSALNLADISARCQTFVELGGVAIQPLDYTGGSEPLQVQTGLVTGGYFSALGVRPLLGRVINGEDDKEGAEKVIVISYSLWQRVFGGDSQILDQVLPVGGSSYRIIGVMPGDFRSPRETVDAWAPIRVVYPLAAGARNVHFMSTYGRLQVDTSLAQAQAEMTAIDEYLAQTYPVENKTRRTVLLPLQERIVGSIREPLMILFAAVGLVLLIACANFANLMLTRASSRHQEMVIRLALGARRGRLIRQVLTESALIAGLGGLAGSFLAWGGLRLLLLLKPANLPRLDTISMDTRVFAFTIAISILTGLIFGLVPALIASRVPINESLKGGGRASTPGSGKTRLQNALVVSELAIALVLLIGAGLLIRSLVSLQKVEPGFNQENLLTMRIDLPEARYREISKQIQYRNSVLEAVQSLPGTQAALISELPLSGNNLIHNFMIEGRPPVAPGDEQEIETRSITHRYFETMQMRLLSGRTFTVQDVANSPFVCVINESAARTYFAPDNALGTRLRWAVGSPDAWMTVIGVVNDVKHFGFDQPELPAIYTLYEQQDQPWKRWSILVVRGPTDPVAMADAIKEKIWTVDRQLPLTKVRSMQEVIAESLAAQRFNLVVLGIFAVVALALAVIGIYGVISYSVSQRTHEIGIRLALGAQSRDVVRMVLQQGLRLAGSGVMLGLMAAFALTRVLESLLFGVTTTDPVTFAWVASLLLVIAALACYLPARRATKVDPMIALRYE